MSISTIVLRCIQAGLLLSWWFGLQQVPAFVTAIRSAIEQGVWDWPLLCQRIVVVTAPLALSSLVLGAIEYAIRTLKKDSIRKNSAEPWLANPMWARQHMRLDSRPLLIALGVIFAIYVLVLWPLAVASRKPALFWIWVGVGLVLLVFMRLLWLGRKWSGAELKIATMPGVIGGPFSAVAIIHHVFGQDTVFDVNLRCVETVETGTRKGRRIQQIDRWTVTEFISKPLDGAPPGTTAIPVSFAIPYEASPTRMTGASPIRWLLTVSEKADVKMGGATFEVPVFKTAQSRRDYEQDAGLMQKHVQRLDPLDVLRRYNLVRTAVGTKSKYEFNEFDSGIFWTLVVMFLMLVGVEVGLWYWIKKPDSFQFATLVIAAILAMIGYGIVYMLFWRSILTVGPASDAGSASDFLSELQNGSQIDWLIEARAGFLGFRKSISVPADKQTRLICRLSHRGNEKEQWSIHLVREEGPSLKILNSLEGQREAEVVARWLAEQLHIEHRKVKAADGFL